MPLSAKTSSFARSLQQHATLRDFISKQQHSRASGRRYVPVAERVETPHFRHFEAHGLQFPRCGRRALGAAEPHSVIIRDGRKAKIYLFAAFTGCYFLVSYPDLSVLCIFDLRIQA